MIGYVYLTVNDVNDIVYVGKRQKPSFEKSYKGSGTHLKLAFKKYGKEKFHTSILECCETVTQLCESEKKWIAYFRDKNVEMYNIAEGGKGGIVARWWEFPEKRVAEIKRKNSDAHKGEKNPFYGKKHTEETKAILRTKNKDKKAPEELIAYKKAQRERLPEIMQLDKDTGELIKVWANWCEAGREVLKASRYGYSHISECCNHKRKTAYGYRWEYTESGWTL